MSERVLDLDVASKALGRRAPVRLLTPRGWSRSAGRRWPVLYLLHGCCDTYESWTRETDIERLPALRDVLVVMPEGGRVGFYANWRGDGKRRGPAWEDFHLAELPRLLESRYRASTERAVAGLSMGGLGAMGYAARRPGVFRAAASFSGLLNPLADARLLLGLLATGAPDPRAVLGDPEADRARWVRHDPTEQAGRLRGVPLYVSSGDGRPGPLDGSGDRADPVEATVHRESRAFARELRRLRIPAVTNFYGPGRHTWPYWERELERALPLLLGALRR